ncbi:hypothetical protein ACEQPO_21195 [Bacillus sp. SL00103]
MSKTVEVLEEYKGALGYEQIETESKLAKVSIVDLVWSQIQA